MKIFDLANLTASEGFRIDGEVVNGSYPQISVSSAGDVNGDDLADVIIGTSETSPYSRTYAGTSYVVYGKRGGYPVPIDLATFNTTTGFRINGAASDMSLGISVSSAGDVNGDGLADVIIGAPGASPYNRTYAGTSYVVYGKRGGYPASIDLASFNTTMGFRIDGAANGDTSGNSVSSAGDVNGDGLADVIIGAVYASPYNQAWAGASYVVYGKRSGYPVSIDLATFNATMGFCIDGAANGDRSGYSVSSTGDVNGDGLDDVIIGAPYARDEAGASYVTYGKSGGYTVPIDLATFNTTLGFRIDGVEFSGDCVVSSAGDVNGDGLADMIIGVPEASPSYRSNVGASYVIYGKRGGYTVPIDLASFNTTLGFRIDGAAEDDQSGTSVSSAGDVNGDGLADVIIGAPSASSSNGYYAGASYVIYGKRGGYTTPIDLATFNTTIGFRIDGAADYDFSGYSVNSAGDVNGDGLADVIIGAPGASYSNQTNTGASYVVYGSYIPCDLLNNALTLQYINASTLPTTILTTDNLFAVDNFYNSTDNQIQFTITNLIAGKFELIRSGQTVTSFNQQQIKEDDVQFVQDGSPNLPAYAVSVSNIKGALSTPQPAIVTFIAPPFIVGNITNESAVVGYNLLNKINIDQIFKDSNYPLQFSATLTNSSTLPSWIQFNVVDNSTVIFNGTVPFAAQNTIAPLSLIATNSFNLTNHADFSVSVPKVLAPSVIGNITDISPIVGYNFIQTINTALIFKDLQNYNLQYSASLTNGSVLPNWLQFTAMNNTVVTLEGNPPFSAQNTIVPVSLIAADPYNISSQINYNVNIPKILAPSIIGNIPNVSVAVDTTFPQNINPTQIFYDPQNYTLQYTAFKANDDSLPDWVQFRQLGNNLVTFDINPVDSSLKGTTTTLSLIATDPYNLSSHAEFNVTITNTTSSPSRNIAGAIAGGTIGGVVGLAALAGSAFGFWRYRKAKHFAEERKNQPLANLLREQLQLSGVDDFQSNAGLAFVNAIEVLVNELQLQDIDVRNMYPNELDTLSVYVANAIKTTVRIATSYFGMYKTINPEDIQNNAGTIARVTKALCQTPINESSYGTFINS